MSARAIPYLPIADYLAQQDASDSRCEYRDGLIVAMSGGTCNHSRIIDDLFALLRNLLPEGCEAFTKDVKIRIDALNSDVYPDLVAACRPLQYLSARRDIIANPVVVAEVLSESTQGYDRGDKFKAYKTVPSIREILLIEQSSMEAEIFRRSASGWDYEEIAGPGALLRLTSFSLELPLRRLYERVEPQEPQP